ncbi:unnamed protein product [Closterium sp. NIES-53]
MRQLSEPNFCKFPVQMMLCGLHGGHPPSTSPNYPTPLSHTPCCTPRFTHTPPPSTTPSTPTHPPPSAVVAAVGDRGGGGAGEATHPPPPHPPPPNPKTG